MWSSLLCKMSYEVCFNCPSTQAAFHHWKRSQCIPYCQNCWHRDAAASLQLVLRDQHVCVNTALSAAFAELEKVFIIGLSSLRCNEGTYTLLSKRSCSKKNVWGLAFCLVNPRRRWRVWDTSHGNTNVIPLGPLCCLCNLSHRKAINAHKSAALKYSHPSDSDAGVTQGCSEQGKKAVKNLGKMTIVFKGTSDDSKLIALLHQ